MTRIVWRFSFCSVHFHWWFKFLEKVLTYLKNVTSIKRLPISKVECFWKSNFWPKSNMQNSAYKTDLLYIFIKFIEVFWSYKKFQKIEVGRGLGWVRIKTLLAQTIPDKIFGTKWSNPVKLNRKRKVWYLLLRVFQLLLAKF